MNTQNKSKTSFQHCVEFLHEVCAALQHSKNLNEVLDSFSGIRLQISLNERNQLVHLKYIPIVHFLWEFDSIDFGILNPFFSAIYHRGNYNTTSLIELYFYLHKFKR